VLLAGVLLKLGTYGMLRFLIPLLPYGTIYFLPLVYTFCIIGIVYGSLTTLRQIDLKKIIAYSSVVHMNFALIGLFALNIEGLQGSIYLMLSHGVVSGALFLCVGCLYDRYHTRIIKYYSGLVLTMPLFSIFFLIFTLANIAFPGTSSFVGEFLIFLGIFKENIFIGFLSALGVILSASYSI
jgi:NADH-quinone oxidoreductase subunit M